MCVYTHTLYIYIYIYIYVRIYTHTIDKVATCAGLAIHDIYQLSPADLDHFQAHLLHLLA